MATIKKKPRPDRAARAAQRRALVQTSDPSRPSEFGGDDVPRYPSATTPRGGYTTGDPSAPHHVRGTHEVRAQLPQGGGMQRTADPAAPRIVDKPRPY